MRQQVVKDIEKEFLEPSFKYLVKNGLENTSVRDLCKDMKISYGSIYYWFEGKEEIYIRVAKYGIGKVADALFSFAFDTMQEPDVFFTKFLDELDKYKLEFRLIVQMTTSPVYGPPIREKAKDFNCIYENYIGKLSSMVNCKPEDLAPIIYSLISVLVDYVVWEDVDASRMQLQFLHDVFKSKIGNK